MLQRSQKVWSDKARAAAIAKRRGQASPTTQSATAADAVAHANALIAAGALNKKGKGKGKGAKPKAAKPKKDARTPQEKSNQNRAQVAQQTGMADLEGTVARLGSGMHSDLEKDAHDKLISKGLAQRAPDGTVTLTALGKKWKASADKGDAGGAQAALAEGQAHEATGAAKDKAKQEAGTARQQKQEAQRQTRAQAQATRAKAQADRAKAQKAKAKERQKAQVEKQKASADKPKKPTLPPAMSDAANALATGGAITPEQHQQLITTGLAKPDKTGALILTPAGRQALAQKATTMQTKANARHSAADMQDIQTAHDMSVANGAMCPTPEGKAAARHSASDMGHFQTIHDSSAALVDGAHCVDAAKAIDMPPNDATDDPTALDAAPPVDNEDTGDEEQASGNTGLIIALQVPPDIASELAIEGGQPSETLHLTLAYLGDATDFQSQRFQILGAVEQAVADATALDATIGGVGRFMTPEDDGTNAFYASVDCAGLTDFRQTILDALDGLGIMADDTHAFTPHITLAYVDSTAPTPPDMPSVTDLTFSTVIVAFGDHQVLFPLGDPAADQAALDAEQDTTTPVDTTTPATSPVVPAKSLSADDTMVNYGGAIKNMPSGHVGGYLVRFSGPNDPDLTGDFFTKDTDFGFSSGETLKTAVYFNHRLPMKTRDGRQMTIKQKIGEGTLTMDEIGVFIDSVLYNREQYESTLDRMGWSSGTASHLVDREPAGKSMWVKSWQLGLDASITPTPAEPRNGAVPLKSFLLETQPEVPALKDARAASTGSTDDDSDMPQLIILRRTHAIERPVRV